MRDFYDNCQTWPVWNQVKVETGYLWGVDAHIETADGGWLGKTLNLAQEPALALELARVNRAQRPGQAVISIEDRLRALLDFVGHAGRLGQRPRPEHLPGCWTLLEDAAWALGHAAALDFVLTLGGAFYCGDAAVVERQLQGLAAADDGLSVATGRGTETLKISDELRSGPVESRIFALADKILSPNIQARRAFEGGRQVLHFDSLFAAAHSQVAESLERAAFGRCETCLRFFPKTDKRQRFCPPAWSTQSESLCGSRARMRKRRGRADKFLAGEGGENVFLLTQQNSVPLQFCEISRLKTP